MLTGDASEPTDRGFQSSGQQTIDILAALRAATLRQEGRQARMADVLRQVGLRRLRRD